MTNYQVIGLTDIGDVNIGDDVADMIIRSLSGYQLEQTDILVVTHKIISKAEGSVRSLDEVIVSDDAITYSRITGKDEKLVQIILDETKKVLYAGPGFLLCMNRLGIVCANAGVDQSNAERGTAVLLPKDPDDSAKKLCEKIKKTLGETVGIIICDTQGRAFRNGAVGVAVGAYGLKMQKSYIGLMDRRGRIMHSSVEAVADEIAAAATLIMGQGDEGIPAVLIRGLDLRGAEKTCDLLRNEMQDVSLKQLLERDNRKQDTHDTY